MTRVATDRTAFSQRDAPFLLQALDLVPGPAHAAVAERKISQALAALRAHSTGGVMVGWLGGGDYGPERSRAAYSFPARPWKNIRTSNSIERLFEEVKQRSKKLASAFRNEGRCLLLFYFVIRGVRFRKLRMPGEPFCAPRDIRPPKGGQGEALLPAVRGGSHIETRIMRGYRGGIPTAHPYR